MRVNWRVLSHLGASIVGTIVPGVIEAETLAWSLPGTHGQEKQDRVVELVKQALIAEQGITGKQLAQDADVEKATRGAIDAIVGLHNIVAQKVAAPTA